MRLRAPKPLSHEYPTVIKTLGDRLRKRRLDLGLLQKDVAKRLRVSEETVVNWELNRTKPQVRLRGKLINFLNEHCCELSDS
ncbi:MAG: helix-turn-helix transcriptional regulator [Fidelibacterota bacterium]